MAQVALRNIVKTFDKTPAVRGIDLDIADREFIVLVGPSGCGKSTTLRMIAGLEECTEGEIYIGDQLVNDVPPKDRDIAMVFQNYALYPHMTVFENMSFGLRLKKFPKQEIKERVESAARILDITELLGRRPKALSGGQRQRVAMGRAIVRNPKVFLFDEPLSNLDAKLRVQMRTEINELHQRLKTTMVYVTHDQIEAMTMADKIVVLKDGLIQQIGTPLGLYNHPINRFVASFIGSPPMNIMTVTVEEQGGKIVINEGSFVLPLEGQHAEILKSYVGKTVLFGVRPEDLKLETNPTTKNVMTANVEVVEPLGAEIHLYVGTANHQLTASVEPNNTFKVGDEVRFLPDMKKANFFDGETEKSILFNEEASTTL